MPDTVEGRFRALRRVSRARVGRRQTLRRHGRPGLVGSLLVLALAGCGGAGSAGPDVDAASSLTEVFQRLEPSARFNFAGSDELARQIREGARVDVYAAASPRYPEQLYEAGLVERPEVFATNRLVVIVPKGRPAPDLTRSGVKVVIGDAGVPIGDYTRAVLGRMGARGRATLRNVVSEERDVKGVVAKVALGEADAGFVYATDVAPVAGKVRAIELPASAQATARYEIAVVRGSRHRREAEAFVDLVTGPRGRAALRAAGFGLP